MQIHLKHFLAKQTIFYKKYYLLKLPYLNYQDRIAAAAREFNFPTEYQSQLAEWLPDRVKLPNDKWIIELEKQREANSRLVN